MQPTRPHHARHVGLQRLGPIVPAPPGGRGQPAADLHAIDIAPLAVPQAAVPADAGPPLTVQPRLSPALAQSLPPADWRSRHPVFAVSLHSAVRDTLGQGVGRTLGLVASSWMLSTLAHDDPEIRMFRERMMGQLGGGMAVLISGVAGIYTANALSLTVHRGDPAGERRSPLWMLGGLPPALTAAGLWLAGRYGFQAGGQAGQVAGVATASVLALSRVMQYFGRDIAGQLYTAATQYRRASIWPGFRLRVIAADGRPLSEHSIPTQNRFNRDRLGVAALGYLALCLFIFAAAMYLQPVVHTPRAGDTSFRANFLGSSAWVLATVVLEALDAVNGVVAHEVVARQRGYTIALNEEETRVENVSEFVLTHGMARVATNGLQDLAGVLARAYDHPPHDAAWLAAQVLPRTAAQVPTEVRGFLANTGIDLQRERLRKRLEAGQPGPAAQPVALAVKVADQPPGPVSAEALPQSPRAIAWGAPADKDGAGMPEAARPPQPASPTRSAPPSASSSTASSAASSTVSSSASLASATATPHSPSQPPGDRPSPSLPRSAAFRGSHLALTQLDADAGSGPARHEDAAGPFDRTSETLERSGREGKHSS